MISVCYGLINFDDDFLPMVAVSPTFEQSALSEIIVAMEFSLKQLGIGVSDNRDAGVPDRAD